MRDAEQTIGSLIDEQGFSLIILFCVKNRVNPADLFPHCRVALRKAQRCYALTPAPCTAIRSPAEKSLAGLPRFLTRNSISSVDDDGFPNTKAMLPPRKREGIKSFWFSTNTSSMRVAQYRANKKACIYFFDGSFHGVMRKGAMEVLEDAKSKEMIWREGDAMYYAKGVTDPDYCILRFTAQTGRYYTSFSSEDFSIKQGQLKTTKSKGNKGKTARNMV